MNRVTALVVCVTILLGVLAIAVAAGQAAPL
jgi:hypothetical protein